MRIPIYKLLVVQVFAILGFSLAASGQVTSSQSSNGTSTPEVARAQESVNKVLLDSGTSFKEALVSFTDGNRQAAGERFNKSVEVFVYYTLNIQREQRLQTCYNQLIETI